MSQHYIRITPDRFDAVLFDLDGVLTSTAKIHSFCWKAMFDAFLSQHAATTQQPFQPFDIEHDYTDRFDAVLFDLDGVLTSTAKIHSFCWKAMFDAFLSQHAATTQQPFQPFDIEHDYKQYVDGKTRYDGVRSFLESRNISLPEGTPTDPTTVDTVCGLGNRKDELVQETINRCGVEPYAGSVALVRQLRKLSIHTAVVSSSANHEQVLRAGILELFDVLVDGSIASELKLPGKPEPSAFLKAAEMLSTKLDRAVVVEDAIAGVQAARAGGFGLVIGVDREGNDSILSSHGADIVVANLAELVDD